MDLVEIARMETQEQNYWWHIGRRAVLRSVLQRWLRPDQQLQILDVGCGTGINYDWLKQWGRVVGLDTSSEALDYCRTKYVYDELVQTDGTNLPFYERFDLITAFDVLEHIPNDLSALNSWYRALKTGGYIFMTVPAYQWLFSAHDKALHHQRRYSVRELKQKFERAGFRVQFISPFFFFTFPALAAVRLLTKAAPPKTSYVATPSLISRFLISLSKSEANFLAHGDQLPWGSSLLVLAQKEPVPLEI